MIPRRADERERYDADEVRLALRQQAAVVLRQLGYDAKRTHSQHELECQTCPATAHNRGRSMIVDLRRGIWACKPCGTGGDMLALVAQTRGLDTHRDFPEVLAVAAELAGVPPVAADPLEVERRRRDLADRIAADERQRAADDDRRRQEQAAASAIAADLWPTLPLRDEDGEHYLASRGIDYAALPRGVARLPRGGIAVGLYSSAGLITNIVTRWIAPVEDRKVTGRKGCPTAGTLACSVSDIAAGADVVLTEGLIDTLTALLAWPRAVVLGAHGADNLEAIARLAAPRIKLAGGRLLLVPHGDDAGERNMVAAGRVAQQRGLKLHKDLIVVDPGGDDLNAGWCRGWRPV